MKRELETLNQGMEAEIQTVREETRRELDLINTERISQDEKNQKIRAANAREARRIDAIRAAYNPKIQEKNKAIKTIQSKIDEYDSRQVEKARKQEEVLNNQQRLFNMELEKTTKYYEERIATLNAKYNKDTTALKDYHKNYVAALEANHKKEVDNLTLKYNPKIADPAVTPLLAAGINQQALKEEYPAKYRPLLEKEGIAYPADYQAFLKTTAEYDRLMAETQENPFDQLGPGGRRSARIPASGHREKVRRTLDQAHGHGREEERHDHLPARRNRSIPVRPGKSPEGKQGKRLYPRRSGHEDDKGLHRQGQAAGRGHDGRRFSAGTTNISVKSNSSKRAGSSSRPSWN